VFAATAGGGTTDIGDIAIVPNVAFDLRGVPRALMLWLSPIGFSGCLGRLFSIHDWLLYEYRQPVAIAAGSLGQKSGIFQAKPWN
jgi:hypothetical protein